MSEDLACGSSRRLAARAEATENARLFCTDRAIRSAVTNDVTEGVLLDCVSTTGAERAQRAINRDRQFESWTSLSDVAAAGDWISVCSPRSNESLSRAYTVA